MRKSLLALSLPLAAALAQPAPPSVDEILAKHAAASGGASALGRLQTQFRKGTIQLAPTTILPFELQAKTGGRWHFTMIMPDIIRISQASDGKTAWSLDADDTQRIPAANWLDSSAAFDFQAPLRLREYFPNIALEGREAVPGREVWVLEAKPPEGPAVPVHFDAQTGLLARLGNTFYEDYREVDGVKIPFRIRSVEGRREEILTTTEVRHNVSVDDALFAYDSSVALHRRALREMTREPLAKALAGIDPGAAGPVLEDLHGFAAADGRFLYDLIVSHGYTRALEIGTAYGNSALWMGLALRRTGGQLITIEMSKQRADAASANFRRAGLEDTITCRNNDAFKEIPDIAGEFDFIFMDTGTRLHKKLLDLLYDRLAGGGTIVSHNANDMERAMPDFLTAISKDPNLETRIVKTPGGGFSVSVKKRQKA